MAPEATITANKELVREFITRVFNGHNAEATPDYFTADAVARRDPRNDRGVRSYDQLLRGTVRGVA
jgi:hypothetical protein